MLLYGLLNGIFDSLELLSMIGFNIRLHKINKLISRLVQ